MNLIGIKYGMVDLLLQNRLRRYGHERREEDDIIKKTLEMEVKEKLPKRRLRNRFMNNVRRCRKESNGLEKGQRES